MVSMNMDGYLTAAQAAELLGIRRESVYSYSQRLPGFPQPTRVGRTVLWAEADIKAWRGAHPSRKANG